MLALLSQLFDQIPHAAQKPAPRPRPGRWRSWTAEIERRGEACGKLSDQDLRRASLDLRWQAREGTPLDRLLPEAFTLFREAAHRKLGLRAFPTQLFAGCALHAGCLAEMETGEGKTLMAALPAYLHALTGKGVHVVTVNDYLALRDAAFVAPVFRSLGLTVGCLQLETPPDDRRAHYTCDVVYATASQFAFDFLKDRLSADAGGGAKLGAILYGESAAASAPLQRGRYLAIIDEADSILIDEARTPLIIASNVDEEDPDVVEAYRWAARVAPELATPYDFTVDRDQKTVELTSAGRWRVRQFGLPAGLPMEELYEYIERAVQVFREFHRDRQFVVIEGEGVAIVDEFTGRVLPGRKWRAGLHQAIEAKEGLPITAATTQAARTTIQTFFLGYERLAGMTGTAWSARRELHRIYRLPVVKIPTHRTNRRVIAEDQIFALEKQKWAAVVAEVRVRHERGQPILIGTRSIEKSEHLSRLLDEARIPHAVLNAKRHAEEAAIIARAGERGAVTIATNMAGRGVDIRLGEGAAELGGLHVLGTERHESARIDRQLVGRSARQGDPGSAQFYVSLEDDLLQNLGPAAQGRLASFRAQAERSGTARADAYRAVFAQAQQRIERRHFLERANLLKYEVARTEMQVKMGLDPHLNTID